MLLKINAVSKKYGPAQIIKNIDLEIDKGKIVGLLGENGAGKSTLLRILAGVTVASSGTVRVDDHPIGIKTRNLVAYIPDKLPFYHDMTVWDQLKFLSKFYTGFNLEKSTELMDFLNIDAGQKIGTLSKGQKSKLNIIAGFSWPSKVLLMDEPLGGIDPVSRNKIVETLFKEFRFGEQTIIIATHMVEVIEGLLEDVIFLKKGKVVLQGNIDELKSQKAKSLTGIFEEFIA